MCIYRPGTPLRRQSQGGQFYSRSKGIHFLIRICKNISRKKGGQINSRYMEMFSLYVKIFSQIRWGQIYFKILVTTFLKSKWSTLQWYAFLTSLENQLIFDLVHLFSHESPCLWEHYWGCGDAIWYQRPNKLLHLESRVVFLILDLPNLVCSKVQMTWAKPKCFGSYFVSSNC